MYKYSILVSKLPLVFLYIVAEATFIRDYGIFSYYPAYYDPKDGKEQWPIKAKSSYEEYLVIVKATDILFGGSALEGSQG